MTIDSDGEIEEKVRGGGRNKQKKSDIIEEADE